MGAGARPDVSTGALACLRRHPDRAKHIPALVGPARPPVNEYLTPIPLSRPQIMEMVGLGMISLAIHKLVELAKEVRA